MKSDRVDVVVDEQLIVGQLGLSEKFLMRNCLCIISDGDLARKG